MPREFEVTIAECVYRTYRIKTELEPTLGDVEHNEDAWDLREKAFELNADHPELCIDEESFAEDYLDIKEVTDGE